VVRTRRALQKEIPMRDRIVSLLVALFAVWLLWEFVRRMFVVVIVQMPWWALILIFVVLLLVIDHYVHKALGTRRR
jgi:divalent metal cation (Fe/Co/Zn/Cd) transporter